MIDVAKVLDDYNESKCQHVEFDEGVCWKIVKPDLIGEQTDSKYCPHKREPEFIHRFKRSGFMEARDHDMMITKACSVCNIVKLIRVDTNMCNDCKNVLIYKQHFI